MSDRGIDGYFIEDVDDASYDDDAVAIQAPAVVRGAPVVNPEPRAVPGVSHPAAPAPPAPVAPQQPVFPHVRDELRAAAPSREEKLADELNRLMAESPDIQAAALVSLDGFIIASALPRGMQEDRVGAMSAAILGLGERAAAELGRGSLTQVFIEGTDGYVILVAAGDRGVLTVLAPREAKLGLVLYDMKHTADAVAGILG